MSALARELKFIAFHNKDGSYTTQRNRIDMFELFDKQLKEMGFNLPSARSLKPKHPQKLVERWKAEGLTAGTIKNRMSGLRYWAGKVNKASVIPRDNKDLGIEDRKADATNKAQTLDLAKIESLPCERMQLAARLMAAYGLRMEEALKFNASLADKGNKIALKASWCKGGRSRDIPIHTEKHRALLDEVKETTGNGSLIPDDQKYITFRKAFEYQTLKAGLSNLHGLRHNFAQWRYKQLTGWKSPKAGGTPARFLKGVQREIDKDARLQISQELGHNRIEITKVYLG